MIQLIAQNQAPGIWNPFAPRLSPINGQMGVWQFGQIIQLVVRALFVAAFVIFFVMFLVGGIKWILSSGDKTKVESARGTIAGSLVGLLLVLSLFAITSLVGTLFGVNILEIDFDALRVR